MRGWWLLFTLLALPLLLGWVLVLAARWPTSLNHSCCRIFIYGINIGRGSDQVIVLLASVDIVDGSNGLVALFNSTAELQFTAA